MRVEVDIYMNNIVKFFKENPKDLLNLVPKDKEEEFYDKIRKVAHNNYKEVEEAPLTQKQLIEVCGEFIVSSDEIDMDGFVKRSTGDGKMVTREVIDQDAERRQVRKNILDELLDDVESKMDEKSKDMKLFLNTVQMLKSLVRVNLLPEDEEDLVSYIKSYPFLTREYFKEYIKKMDG